MGSVCCDKDSDNVSLSYIVLKLLLVWADQRRYDIVH